MSETGQVTANAAEIYDERFLPAIFNEWPPRVVDLAKLEPGMRVLDVACGTGVLSLVAAEAVMPDGAVVGLDLNPGMLEVARRKAPRIDWREASAEAIPFEDATFDAVVSQFGLMFVEDKARAIREMVRVLRPDGKLAVAVWDSLEKVTGYGAFTGLLSRLFGDSAAESLRAPYSLGDTQILSSLFSVPGALDVTVSTLEGRARYPSIRYWMEADIRGWTLSDSIRLRKSADLSQHCLNLNNGKVRVCLSKRGVDFSDELWPVVGCRVAPVNQPYGPRHVGDGEVACVNPVIFGNESILIGDVRILRWLLVH